MFTDENWASYHGLKKFLSQDQQQKHVSCLVLLLVSLILTIELRDSIVHAHMAGHAHVAQCSGTVVGHSQILFIRLCHSMVQVHVAQHSGTVIGHSKNLKHVHFNEIRGKVWKTIEKILLKF